jgi:hypothetical protein
MANEANPIAVDKTGRKVQWNGSAWLPLLDTKTEAGSVAARPAVTGETAGINEKAGGARETFKTSISKPLTDAPNPKRTMVLSQGTGAMGNAVTGTETELAPAEASQRNLAETTGAVLGGEITGPLELAAGGTAMPRLAKLVTRAVGTGAGAGGGAETSGASHKDALKTAGVFGATELGLHALFSGGEAIYNMLADPKMSMQHVGQMLAETLSREELSPAQFGKGVQDGFDSIARKAGQEKGEFITRVTGEHPDLTVNPRNLRQVLESRVQALETMKTRNPELFKEGEAQERTLKILRKELDSTNGEASGIRTGIRKGNLETADTRRSQFWNYKQSLDPSNASRIIGELDKAATQDITEALVTKDKKLAEEYLQKSSRYHEMKDLGRAETLKNVFGNARVAPDKVVQVFTQAPEESLKAIQTIEKENPVAIQRLRRALFEQGIKTTGVNSVFKQQPALLKAIYGPQADAVKMFVDTVNAKTGADSLLTKVPGKLGAMFRIATGGGRGVMIKTSEMNKILKSSEMTRLFTQAAKTPANSGPGRLLKETLDRAIKAADIQTGESVAATRAKPPGWKGAVPEAGSTPEAPPAEETPLNLRTRPGTPGSPGSRTATWKGGGTAPGTRQGPVTREPLWKQPIERRTSGGERRTAPGTSPTGAERRSTGADSRQIYALTERLKGATDEEKALINEQIKQIRENPGAAEYEDRRGKREAGGAAPKADPAKMRDAIEKQRKRLEEFEAEYQRILREQGQ